MAVRDHALAEAARIWSQYGVMLEAVEGVGCTEAHDSLRVIFDLDPGAGESEDSLGGLRFTSEGVPERSVAVHYGTVMRLVMSEPINGLDPRQWPVALHNEIAGRALGRALAHEVGHYLLRWPHHPVSGLMRSRYRPSALVDPDLTAFELTAIDRARFQIVLNAFPAQPAQIVNAPAGCQLIAFNRSPGL
jgi:hypothetical protein